LLYFSENALKKSEMCTGCSYWVEIVRRGLFGH